MPTKQVGNISEENSMTGRLQYVTATFRIGYKTANSVPVIGPTIDSPSITLTAANSNSATIFFKDTAVSGATDIRKMYVPLTAGQSFTFTGVPLGNMGYRNVAFGTGNPLYLAANSTPQVAIFGYYKQG
jgi:hypothetical protein